MIAAGLDGGNGRRILGGVEAVARAGSVGKLVGRARTPVEFGITWNLSGVVADVARRKVVVGVRRIGLVARRGAAVDIGSLQIAEIHPDRPLCLRGMATKVPWADPFRRCIRLAARLMVA